MFIIGWYFNLIPTAVSSSGLEYVSNSIANTGDSDINPVPGNPDTVLPKDSRVLSSDPFIMNSPLENGDLLHSPLEELLSYSYFINVLILLL